MKEGDKLGDYVVERPISVGKTGQADIYLARHRRRGGEKFAVKVLAQQLKGDATSLHNFEEEAEILTKLRHAHTVRLEAFDTSPPNPYIVQEFIDGPSLAEFIKKRDEPLPLGLILDLATQMADALSYAHSLEHFRIRKTSEGGKSSQKIRGIIHRDLSSDNILIKGEKDAKLIDFGIARAVGVKTITTTSGIGKAFYVAPEVELGCENTFTPAVDIYSFGVCLYEMVMTGRPERHRVSVLKQFQKNLHNLYSSFPECIPQKLRRLIEHCVQREPESRPESMARVLQVLGEIREELMEIAPKSDKLPPGFKIGSPLLAFQRMVRLDRHDAGDTSLRFSLNQDETRILVLCERQAKVCSFNLSGGERKVHHVPQGRKLASLVGLKGEEAVGRLTNEEGLLFLDGTGEWHFREDTHHMAPPTLVPDNLIALGEHVYAGDYRRNTICRFSAQTGDVLDVSAEGRVERLGPLGTDGKHLFGIDMLTMRLFRANPGLDKLEVTGTVANVGWPVSLAVKEDLAFLVDAEARCLSGRHTDGDVVIDEVLGWSDSFEVSQILLSEATSHLYVLDSSTPALLVFEVKPIDWGCYRLLHFVKRLEIVPADYTYQAIENAVTSYIDRSGDREASAGLLLSHLKRYQPLAREGADLEAAVYSHLIDAVGQEKKASLIREAGLRMAELGHRKQAEQFYARHLDAVQGYDPQIRDKYGEILEDGQRWEEIKELEGSFLSQYLFKEADSRAAYERSYARLRRAYSRLGIPLPTEFEAAPITRFLSAKELIDNRQYQKARAAFADMFEDGAYKNLSAEHAIFLLAAYARSVKLCLRALTVSDWQEIYRALYVVDRDYHDKNSDAEQHRRDLAAAQRQIEKLGGTVPEM